MDNPLRISVAGGSPTADGVTPKGLSSPRDELLLAGARSGEAGSNGATFETEDAASARGTDVEGGGGFTFDVEDAGERGSQRKRGKSSSKDARKIDHLFTSPALQEKCRHLVHNNLFEALVTTIVLSNTICLAYKGPNRQLEPWAAEMIDTYDFACTVLYTIEMCIRIAAYGAVDGRDYEDGDEAEDFLLQRKALLRDPWGRLDFFIIVMSWTSYGIQALELEETTIKTSMLRSLRVLRILHSIQYFKSIRAILTSLQYSVEYRACFCLTIAWSSCSSQLLTVASDSC